MNIQGKIGPQASPIQEITVHTDTRDILAHARRNAIRRGLQDMFVCDIDAHHVETVSWKDIVTYIEDPVVRDNAVRFQNEALRPMGSTAISDSAINRSAAASRTRTASARSSKRPACIATSS
jgi:hypothetical protein